MKKFILIVVAIMATAAVFSQEVQRNTVILEIATGTWCQFCPGAAIAADQLVADGAQVAVIEYHNNDAFTNAASNARNTYYSVPGFPTGHFDGPANYVGGSQCPGSGVDSIYLSRYNSAYAVPSPLTIDISGTNAGNNYTVVLSIHKVGAVTGTNLKAMLVLTETNISTASWPPGWNCMTEVDYVERLMAPDQNGTSFNFSSGDMQIIIVSFTKNASWVNANCELVAFVQDYSTKTIYNGTKVALNSLPTPVSVDFTATTTTGCTPLSVNYTGQPSGVDTYQWDLPGGTPSSPTTQNPSVTYYTAGTYDATLTAWNSSTFRGNKKIRPAYLNVLSVPGTPGTPVGPFQLCINPPVQGYFATEPPNATSYTWDLQPPSAGIITPSGNNCAIDFDNAYTGTAVLKVKATNSCGDGPWSPGLGITISTQPSVPGTPTGTALLCMNPGSMDYQTTGSTPVTSYVWEITPYSAGSIAGTWTTGTVNWAPTYVGIAHVRVKAINEGCEGLCSAYLDVNIQSSPGVFSMTGGGPTCATQGTGIDVGLNGSQTGINYTLYLNTVPTATMVPGTGGAISFGNQLISGNYSSVANNPATTCSTPMNGFVEVTVDPQVPDAPAQPTGNGAPAPGTTTDYTTAGGTYATSYSWDVTPANAGTFTGSTTTGSITWSPTYEGPASITVQGVNSCGAGSYSVDFPVNVTTGIAEPTKQKIVTLYPNPAKGMINIIPLFKMKTDLKVFNALGCVVIEKNSLNLNRTYQLDISGLAPGIYYFNILTDDAQQIQKVIVE